MQPLDSMRFSTPATSARSNPANFNVNCSTAWTPHHISVMKTLAPFHTQKHSEAFLSSKKWNESVSGIRGLQKLREQQKVERKASSTMNSTKRSLIDSNVVDPTDMLMVSGHSHGHLVIWNAENYSLLGSALHYNSVTVLDLVVADTLIYSVVEKNARVGKKEDDIDIYVWNLNTLELVHTLAAHEDAVKSIAVDPKDELRCVTGGVDRTIYAWDLRKLPNPVAKLTGHTMLISKLLLTGNLVVSASHDSTLRLWDLPTQTCLSVGEGHQGPINTLYWFDLPPGMGMEGGLYTITACASGMIRCYCVETVEVKRHTTSSSSFDAMSPQISMQSQQSKSLSPQTQSSMVEKFEKKVLSLVWSNKAHKSLTTEVCWDEDLVISSSASDGINFFIMSTKTNNKFPLGDTGVRRLAIDPVRKLLVAGTDSGQLILVNYGPLVGSHTEGESVGILASLQPHLGSIVGIRLQRAMDGRWERLITAGNDQTLFTLDFDVQRDGKLFTGSGLRCFCEINQTGSCITASDNIGILWNPYEMTKKEGRKKYLDGHAKRIASIRYSEELKRIISGSEDGIVRVWSVTVSTTKRTEESIEQEMMLPPALKEEAPKDEKKKDSSVTSLAAAAAANQQAAAAAVPMVVDCTMSVRTMSRPQRHLIAVGIFRPGVTKAGAVGVFNFAKGIWHVPPVPTYVFPENVELLLWEAKTPIVPQAQPLSPDRKETAKRILSQSNLPKEPEYFFIVLAQLRNSEVIMFTGDTVNTGKFTGQRQMVREAVSYSLEREQEVNLPAPVPISASLVFPTTKAMVAPPPQISLLTAEDKTIRSIECGCEATDTPHTSFSVTLDSVILDLKDVRQGPLFAIAATENGTVFALNARGDVIFSIGYDGAVVNDPLSSSGHEDSLAALQQKSRRKRNLVQGPHEGMQSGGVVVGGGAMRSPPAACLCVSTASRFIIIGYKDGVIQICDFSARKICRRIHAHSTSVYRCWFLEEAQRLVSTSVAGTLRFDPMYNRNIREVTSTGGAEKEGSPTSQ